MMLTKFLTVAALAIASVSAVSPTVTKRTLSLNPSPDVLVEGDVAIPQVLARQLTNGRRLRDGLKLKPPTRRSRVARDAAASPVPVTTTRGYLLVKNAETGDNLGYVSNSLNSFGEYGQSTATLSNALQIEFNEASTDSFSITTLNGPNADYPFFGGIRGFANSDSDISAESYNYVFIGGTTETPAGSKPVAGDNTFTLATSIAEEIESAIWTYTDGKFSPQWINSDSSAPITYIGVNGDVLLLTGDKTAFANSFGSTTWVTLEFVAV